MRHPASGTSGKMCPVFCIGGQRVFRDRSTGIVARGSDKPVKRAGSGHLHRQDDRWRCVLIIVLAQFILLLHTDYGGAAMARIKVNLTLDAEVAEMVRALGLNMSRLAEQPIAKAAKAERNRLWRAENHAAILAYADEVARDGLPLAALRTF